MDNIIIVIMIIIIVMIMIIVSYAHTAAVEFVLLTGSTEYADLSGMPWTSKFGRKVCLFFCVCAFLSMSRAFCWIFTYFNMPFQRRYWTIQQI